MRYLDFHEIQKIKQLYESGENVIDALGAYDSLSREDAILFSYDLQSGNYVKNMENPDFLHLKEKAGSKLAKLIQDIDVSVVCEAGVGEATTLAHVSKCMSNKAINFAGFDISVSRLLYARSYLNKLNQTGIDLFAADLNQIPYPSNSVGCIMTFHAIEPNGGSEDKILRELIRVSSQYILLIEPDYDMFSDDQRSRMQKLGYCRHLRDRLVSMGLEIVMHEPWEIDGNQLNKASLILAKKNKCSANSMSYVSPISGTPLSRVEDGWYSSDDGFLFPEVRGIPILMKSSGILVTHYK